MNTQILITTIRKLPVLLLALLLFATLPSCRKQPQEFVILSGSENGPLEKIVTDFASQENTQVKFKYEGSVDIMLELQKNPSQYDAVWPASGLWISLGDKERKVKYAQSILTSPVVFGIKKSFAQKLGFIGRDVKVADILKAIREKKLRFIMTSASQSNSGASAYIGFLYALLGNPEYVTSAYLDKPELKKEITDLLSGINRSSGSSAWLKDLYLKGDFDAMVNYESLIIEANQQLVREGKEPLYVIYPVDGLVIADSQLGYIDNGDPKKEDFFKKLQAYLLSDKVQSQLLALGRRTGFAGKLKNAPDSVFNPEWGINPSKILSPIKLPKADVILRALMMYQTGFRKPSLTFFCLDYSGSMQGDRSTQLRNAMEIILDQEKAAGYFLQSSPGDVTVVIPFAGSVIDAWPVEGNKQDDMTGILAKIRELKADGNTDIYSPVILSLNRIVELDSSKFIPAIILMTDGESNTGKHFGDLEEAWKINKRDVPVFLIKFGDASDAQLEQIASLTNGAVFDGRKDLISAFRKVKGYN
jgi:Ca-activated chloride channel homolog